MRTSLSQDGYAQALSRDLHLSCPAPSAGFMAPREPNLPRRMLNELTPSPVTGTKD
ncbi:MULTISPECIES: hypothetical protein [unclassified Pseudomonas]|uniref:hypothetical protein n=1 Tax=unclassified Pseudomonas TaxID=196821 RepID=UPI003CE92167